jgi:hypothetical protein
MISKALPYRHNDGKLPGVMPRTWEILLDFPRMRHYISYSWCGTIGAEACSNGKVSKPTIEFTEPREDSGTLANCTKRSEIPPAQGRSTCLTARKLYSRAFVFNQRCSQNCYRFAGVTREFPSLAMVERTPGIARRALGRGRLSFTLLGRLSPFTRTGTHPFIFPFPFVSSKRLRRLESAEL